MAEPHARSLLVSYFETFLKNQDIDAFLASISGRYTEGTLGRLAQSDDVQARRAAVMALGHIGGYAMNGTVAKGLSDPDPTVRELTVHALWAIWFRADTPDNNAQLEQIRELNSRGQHERAIMVATELIAKAPKFAEVYNQRAIAHFCLDRFDESAEDCLRVLEHNPHHFGALGGLGQSYLHLNRLDDALTTYKRALRVQPYNEGIKAMIQGLEKKAPNSSRELGADGPGRPPAIGGGDPPGQNPL